MTRSHVTGIVLAAGGSRRLGSPKQLLPYGNTTLLGASLDVARDAGFDQLIVTLGGAADAVRQTVPLDGAQVVTVDDFGTGCSSSLVAALARVDPESAGIVLLLGDQPGIDAATIRRVIGEVSTSDLLVCRYDDGIGHPFWFSRNMFGDLERLHGDKGVWKLLHSGEHPVREISVHGPTPLDVDTWEDYRRLVESVPS